MARIEAKDCKNFKGQRVRMINESPNIRHLACVSLRCGDKKDCDWIRVEEIRDTHFEPKIPPIGGEEIIHTF